MELFSILITSYLGVLIPIELNHKSRLGPVLSSAGPSLLFAMTLLICDRLLSTELSHHLPTVFFGASFIGMSTRKRIAGSLKVLFAALIFAFIYITSRNIFIGAGGGLGTIAFISVIATIGLNQVFSAIQRSILHKG